MATTRVRAVLRRVGLAVSGLLVVALTAGVVAAASLQAPPEATVREVEPQTVSSGATTWVCAPAPLLLTEGAGEDLEYDPDLDTGGGQISTRVELTAIGTGEAPQMSVGVLGGDAAGSDTAGVVATTSQPDVRAPFVGVVEPIGDAVPLVAGLSVARADSGDLRGLSVTGCQQPVTGAVLVGGSTELGSSARLVLSNPGDTAATVTLSGWGATGPLPEVAPIVVPAGGVRELLLETISLEPRIAIRLDVDGGRVVPTLQDTALDGFIPAGTEIVGPTADPTTELTVAGVDLTSAEGAAAALRLVNPGETAAAVTVEMLGPEGAFVLEGAQDSVIEPGTVADISLAGVPDGQYGLRVTSDVPVTGAVRLARTGTAGEDDPDTPPVDVAWLPASAPVDRGVLPIPTKLVDSVRLTVTNPGEAAIDVAVTGYDAAGEVVGESSIPLEAGQTQLVDAPEGAIAVVLEGDGLVGSLLLTADAADGPLVSASPIVADPYTEQSVAVRVAG